MQHCQVSAEGIMFLEMSSIIRFRLCTGQIHALDGDFGEISVKHMRKSVVMKRLIFS